MNKVMFEVMRYFYTIFYYFRNSLTILYGDIYLLNSNYFYKNLLTIFGYSNHNNKHIILSRTHTRLFLYSSVDL